MKRRKYLALTSVALTGAVAGCSGDDDTNSDDGDDTPATDTPTETPEQTETPERTPEPTETPEPTPEPEPEFRIESVSYTEPVVADREFELTVVVANDGLADGETTVRVTLGEAEFETTVSVAAERQAKAELTITASVPANEYDMQIVETATGTEAVEAVTVQPNEPDFALTELDVPSNVTRYETRNVPFTVENSGFADGDAELVLSVAGEQWTKSLTVPSKETKTDSFKVDIEFSADEYTLELSEQVSGDSKQGTLTVGKHVADKQMDKAHDDISDAYDLMLDAADGGETLLDVNASVKVSEAKIEQDLLDARNRLRNVRDEIIRERQTERRKSLTRVQWFFWWMVDYQASIYDSFRNIRFAWRLLLNQANFSPSGLSNARTFADDAKDPLEKLKNQSDAADFEAFDRIPVDTVEKKLEDFDREIQAPTPWDEFFYQLEFVVNDIERGIDEFEKGNDDLAESHWEPEFDNVDEIIETTDWAIAYEGYVEDSRCIIDGLKSGTTALVDLAQKYDSDTEDSELKSLKTDVRAAFDECEMVWGLSPKLEEFLNAD